MCIQLSVVRSEVFIVLSKVVVSDDAYMSLTQKAGNSGLYQFCDT